MFKVQVLLVNTCSTVLTHTQPVQLSLWCWVTGRMSSSMCSSSSSGLLIQVRHASPLQTSCFCRLTAATRCSVAVIYLKPTLTEGRESGGTGLHPHVKPPAAQNPPQVSHQDGTLKSPFKNKTEFLAGIKQTAVFEFHQLHWFQLLCTITPSRQASLISKNSFSTLNCCFLCSMMEILCTGTSSGALCS